MSSGVPPASFTACHGLVSSTSSTPDGATRNAIRLSVNSFAMLILAISAIVDGASPPTAGYSTPSRLDSPIRDVQRDGRARSFRADSSIGARVQTDSNVPAGPVGDQPDCQIARNSR